MGDTHTPQHIEARMLAAMRDLTNLARDRRLDDVFEFELYLTGQSVQDAMHTKLRHHADQAMEAIHALAMQIASATTQRSTRGPGESAFSQQPGPAFRP